MLNTKEFFAFDVIDLFGGLVREALELTGGRITQREMAVDIFPDLLVVWVLNLGTPRNR